MKSAIISSYLLVIFLLSITSGWGFSPSEPDCSMYQIQNEKILVKKLKRKSYFAHLPCLMRDQVAQDAMRYLKDLVLIFPKVKQLPQDISRKWRNLNYKLTQIVPTDIDLCLSKNEHGECDQESLLVAKNYRFRKKGFILISRGHWKKLSRVEKYSIMLHETLALLGYERNSYEYSSVLNFSIECDTDLDLGIQDCYVVMRSDDNELLIGRP